MHLVIPETYPERLYPTNALRSLAHQLVLTEWVFVLDADLVPNAAAHVFDHFLRHALTEYIPKWREHEIQVRSRRRGRQHRRRAFSCMTLVEGRSQQTDTLDTNRALSAFERCL